MKKLLTLLISILIFQTTFAQSDLETKMVFTTLETQIYFDFNQAEISPTEQLKIDNLLQQAKTAEGNISQVVLRGHTDNFGSDYYNKNLSDKRAKAVEKELIRLGISEAIIAIQAFGEFQLVITKGNKTEQQENRRVIVELTYEKTINLPKPIIEEEKNSTDFYNNTKKPYESFAITAGQATFVEGKEGTRLQFLDTSFDQLPKGTPIEIRLTEYYRFSDMLLANLTTEINGEMLSTGGMINAEAFANGKPINMTGQAYVWFPHKERNMDNMQPFFGEEGEQGVTWNVYAENFNESEYLRRYYNYLNSIGGRPIGSNNQIAGRRFTRWERFWHIFLYGKADYLQEVNGYTFGRSNILADNYVKENAKKVRKEFEKFLINPDNEKSLQAALAYEIMSVSKLGFINCDAFRNRSQEDTKMLTIKEKPSNGLFIKVLCKRVNGILPAYPSGNDYVTMGLPKNENIIVVAIRTSNETPELAIKKMNKIQDINQNDLVFQTYDNIDDMRKAMRVLD